MKHLSLLLAALLFSVLLPAVSHATPVNYTRLNAFSSNPSSYLTDLDVQQGTAVTFSYASTEALVSDLPAAVAADHGGTVCKSAYTRLRVLGLYSTCARIRCTFGDASPAQQVTACVADNYNSSSQTNSFTLTSGSDSITFTADAHTVSY